MPPGVFSLLFDAGLAVGAQLVSHPAIKAVGFTGSRGGGMALTRIAQARDQPIPVYAEMSSINPVILFPGALDERGEEIGQQFVQALTLGAGQFCTNPGLVLAVEGPALARFMAGATKGVEASVASTMLTPGIHQAYVDGVETLRAHAGVSVVARGVAAEGHRARPALFETDARTFLAHAALRHEIFGPTALVVRCADLADLAAVIAGLEGQLTAALHVSESDYADAKEILPALETKVGRILVNGFGTGVEVADAMVHGGPFPATSDGRSTSVGSLAIDRFLRPVSYQNFPSRLLPTGLLDAKLHGAPRLGDGRFA
jgi:NADP-dependent aldehyde dehydrogenase